MWLIQLFDWACIYWHLVSQAILWWWIYWWLSVCHHFCTIPLFLWSCQCQNYLRLRAFLLWAPSGPASLFLFILSSADLTSDFNISGPSIFLYNLSWFYHHLMSTSFVLFLFFILMGQLPINRYHLNYSLYQWEFSCERELKNITTWLF